MFNVSRIFFHKNNPQNMERLSSVSHQENNRQKLKRIPRFVSSKNNPRKVWADFQTVRSVLVSASPHTKKI